MFSREDDHLIEVKLNSKPFLEVVDTDNSKAIVY